MRCRGILKMLNDTANSRDRAQYLDNACVLSHVEGTLCICLYNMRLLCEENVYD
jgi:hypothetical protein